VKDIPGYEGRYAAAKDGRIWSHPNRLHNGIWLKPSLRRGYPVVSLCNIGGTKMFNVHRLVAITHVKNVGGFGQINHKNGVKTDNRACNLEWCSGSHNIQHSWDSGLQVVTERKREASRRNAYTMLRKRVKGRYLGASK